MLSALKRVPVDLAQGVMKEKTMGKLIAFSYVEPTDTGRAIDVGCRDGYWSKKLAQKGYEVTSIDLFPQGHDILRVDIEDGLPFEDESFDVVWCSEVIEHTWKAREVIQELIRISKNNGLVLLTTPNSSFWLMKVLHCFGITPQRLQNPDHKQFFDLTHLKTLLPQKHEIFGFFPYMLVRRQIRRLVGLLSPTFVVVIKKTYPPQDEYRLG